MSVVLITFAGAAAVLFFTLAAGRKSCPDCGHQLPSFQSPLAKTRRQWLEGGVTCPHCGCQVDASGNRTPHGPGRQWDWIIFGMAVPVALLVLSVWLFL